MPTSAWLCCPSYPLADAAAASAAQDAAQSIAADLGWRCRSSPLNDHHPGQGCWLPAEQRAADLRQGLEQYEIIWALRGGHGALDLLPELTSWPDPPAPRLLIGYSDLTVLHAWWQRSGWGEGLYGLMPGVGHGPRARHSLQALARGQGLIHGPSDLPTAEVLRAGCCEAPLCGGCLSLLAALAGGPAALECHNRILLIEDIDEAPYRLDRMLRQLALAGLLTGLRGILAGRFPWTPPTGYAGPDHQAILRHWADRLAVPCLGGMPLGHDPDPLTLALGRVTRLELASDGQWLLAQAAR